MRNMGVDPFLEEQGDRILAEDRKRRGVEAKNEDGYLTPGQLESRRYREVYNKNGFPESHLYSGLFRRVYNPMINKRSTKPVTDDEWG